MVELAQQLATIALQVAQEASEIAAAGWRQRPQAAKKAPADLVTEYDLSTERFIRSRLDELAPDFSVMAEEEGGAVGSGPAFYCDPIDGTTNFFHGHPFWAVSIGVVDGGMPIAGAVVAPALQTTWMGWQGGGALRNGERCCVSPTPSVGDALIATGFPLDRSREPDNNFASFARVKRAARAVRRCGSAAIDCCLVADGTYDAYWERRLHIWDVAAGSAIALAAGGRLTALDGGPPNLERGHVLLSNGRVHDQLIPLVCGPR
jgi:myo-inositol-1(or 4)-monophosphatase